MSIFFITFAAVASWTQPVAGWLPSHDRVGYATSISSLASLALEKVLGDGSPVFGLPTTTQASTATWMKQYSDDTRIVHMNIPGTHDAATWNFSKTTQESLEPITDLVNITEVDPSFYRCQNRSMSAMLNAGIRVFDLRYAYDVTKSTLVFWHGNALQSETATVDDVLYSFYDWLDSHSSEALFLSFQHEGGNNDLGTQLMLFNTLTSPAAKRYILQIRGTLGTLGEARGKITLLRRFDLDLLPASYGDSMPGLHFSPNSWTDNGANITLVYNQTTGETAYIEDYYSPETPKNSSAGMNIHYKLNATDVALRRASESNADSLHWSFASSTNTGNNPPDTPLTQALGNGTLTPEGGVNQQLVPILKSLQGKRLGIVMFDFFEEPDELLPLFLGLLSPDQVPNYGS
ncbi:hypothetical protein DOTSEDRAFT_134275 [Dothistroma septosporum NZE10]|uniref:Phosphatidylinositol-specific phospholipase C X domain-containing protein n=1 Tax=Dothistroma septosporum (strain NZE10 / CBS 128990) TaxID=675120 RepID=N1PKI3_DOTSN|nr:hypothetical protein DOTSEDRAFT_134275 [Dothistroma septosporum NZE10]